MRFLVRLLIVCAISSIKCGVEGACRRRNCNLRTKCPESWIVDCLVSPCSTLQAINCKPQNVEDAVCIDNFCGDCNFCWYDGAGKELQCKSLS